MEVYSIGMCVCLKRFGVKHWGVCLIPFAVFYYAEKLTGGFKILIFPVKKWCRKVLGFCVLTLLCYLFGVWAAGHQNPEHVHYLFDILWLVAGTCIGIVWLGIASSTDAILFRLNPFLSKIESCACYLLIPVPFLLMFQKKRNQREETCQAEEDKSKERKMV